MAEIPERAPNLGEAIEADPDVSVAAFDLLSDIH